MEIDSFIRQRGGDALSVASKWSRFLLHDLARRGSYCLSDIEVVFDFSNFEAGT